MNPIITNSELETVGKQTEAPPTLSPAPLNSDDWQKSILSFFSKYQPPILSSTLLTQGLITNLLHGAAWRPAHSGGPESLPSLLESKALGLLEYITAGFPVTRSFRPPSEAEDAGFCRPGPCHVARLPYRTLFLETGSRQSKGAGGWGLKWPENIIISVNFLHVGGRKEISPSPFRDTKVGERGTTPRPENTAPP